LDRSPPPGGTGPAAAPTKPGGLPVNSLPWISRREAQVNAGDPFGGPLHATSVHLTS
ncbi:MAG: hypothetical protein QOE59_2376, partial [Actinomycetota bacterium]|nr:hypothetical protein [Actinomycetota bacterium]